MTLKTIHENWAAFYPETTVATPPADYAADGIAIEHVSFDINGLKAPLLDDPTLEGRAFAVGTRRKIPGPRNVDASAVLKLHGVGEVTADGDQVADTYLAKILKHTMGAVHRGTSRTITGGTTTVPTVDDATGIIPGSLIAFEDKSSPTDEFEGRTYFRRVLSISGTSLHLDEALPVSPANGDACHAAITGYLKSSILADALASAGGPHTFNWLVKRESSGADLLWRLDGCVASMSLDGLGNSGLPTINLAIMAANFAVGGADGLTNPTLATPEGHAQLAMGRDTICSIQDYGTTAIALRDINQCNFDVGYTRERVQTTTRAAFRFEGLASYTFSPGKTRFTCTLLPWSDDWYADLQAGQTFRISLQQPGDGSGAGKQWCLYVPKAQLVEVPSRADVGAVHGVQLVFEAQEATDCSGGSNTDLERSRFLIGLA